MKISKVIQVLIIALLSVPAFAYTQWSKSGGGLWTYRKAISVINTSASVVNDFQVSVSTTQASLASLISAAKLQANYNDVRFGDINNKELPYWIDLYSSSSSAVFWVRVATINASVTPTTIYLYYGNPYATQASSGNLTFLLFDDFNGASIDTAKWTIESGTWSLDTGSLFMEGGGSNIYSNVISNDTFAGNFILHGRSKIYTDDTGRKYPLFTWGWQNDSNNYFCYSGRMTTTYVMRLIRRESAVEYTAAASNTATYVIPGVFQDTKVEVVGSTHAYTFAYVVRGTTGTWTTFPSGKVGVRCNHENDNWYDNIFVRKYASPEPVADGLGAEQSTRRWIGAGTSKDHTAKDY